MKFKALKWWQAVLIVVSVIGLAVGGVFLYQYLTQGFSGKNIYPETILFEGEGEVENYPIFNEELGQFEINEEEEFSLTITSPTEELTRTNITLSFHESFSGQGDNPWVDPETNITYISNGKIRVPQQANIGKPFKVEVLTSGNFGGISTLYAKSENYKVTKANIAVDEKTKELSLSAIDTSREEGENEIDLSKNKVVEGTQIKFLTNFLPENSKYGFGDNSRAKDVFYSTSNSNVLEFKYNDGNVYFNARGNIGQSATINAYAFANYKDQAKFYEEFKEFSGESLYNVAISRFSAWLSDPAKKDLVATTSAELSISQANVNSFSVTNATERKLKANKLGVFTAGTTAGCDSLGISVTDEHGSLPSMFSNLAIAFGTLDENENFHQASEVKVVGSEKTWERDGIVYTYILSDGVMNLNNASWEISSQTKGSFVARLILLTTAPNDEGVPITAPWNEKFVDIPFTFTEEPELPISWKDNSPIKMTIIHAGNITSTESPRKLYENLDIPENNTYRREIYLAKLNQNLILGYTTASDYIEYSKEIRYNDEIYYEVSGDLLIKKAISDGLSVYFATIRTDAYGKAIPGANGKYNAREYNIEQLSNAIEVSAVDTLLDSDFNATVEGFGVAKDPENSVYFIPTGGEGVLKLTFTPANVDLFMQEWNLGRIEIYAQVGDEEERELLTKATATKTENVVEVVISTNKKDFGESDRQLNILIDYNNTITTRKVGNVNIKDNCRLEIYTPMANSLNLSLKGGENSTEATGTFTVNQSMNANGEPITDWGIVFVPTQLIGEVKDRHNRIMEEEQVTYSIEKAPNGLVFIDREGNISFGTGSAEGITVKAQAGKAEANFTLDVNSVGITHYHIFDEVEGQYEGRKGEERQVEAGQTLSTTMTGWAGNKVELKSLISLFSKVDETNTTKIDDSAYKFTFTNAFFASIAGREDFLDEMLTINNGGTTFANITASTRIESIEIKNHFGSDLPLSFLISNENGGINVVFTLSIESNVANSVDNFALKDGERKVYAQYGYNLGSNTEGIAVNLKRTSKGELGLGGTLSWGDTKANILATNGEELGSIEGGVITFNERYEDSDIYIFNIYNMYDTNGNGNPFGFVKSISAPILMNLKVSEKNDGFVDFATIAASDNNSVGNYLNVERIHGSKGISNISYTLSNVPNNVINMEEGNLTAAENNYFNLDYGVAYKTFTVHIDVDGNEVLTQELKLGYKDITIENIAEANSSYASKVLYNGVEYLMLSVDGKKNTFNSVAGASITQTVLANARCYTISAENEFTMAVQDSALAYGIQRYLRLQVQNDRILGEVRIPILISSVGQKFASYGEDPADLADLLNAEKPAENRDGKVNLFIERNAGTNEAILFDVDSTGVKGIIYDSSVATASLSIGKNYVDKNGQALASIEGDRLVLNNLVLENKEDKVEIIISVRLTGKISQKVLTYIYRVMVSGNTTVQANYPYVDDTEYLTLSAGESKKISLDENFTSENATQNIGESRFNIDKEGLSYTDYLSSLEIDGIPQSLPTVSQSSGESSVWTIPGKLTISISNDHKLSFTLHDASVGMKVGITRSWSGVVGGFVEYIFFINAGVGSNTTYSLEFVGEDIKDDVWSLEPKENVEQILTATTKWHSGSQSGAVDVNAIKTNASITLKQPQDATISIEEKEEGEWIISNKIQVKYDYRNSQVSVKVLEYLDKDYEMTLNFSRDIAIGSLTIKVAGSVKVAGTTEFSGGKSYEFAGLIGTVERYGRTDGVELSMYKESKINVSSFENITPVTEGDYKKYFKDNTYYYVKDDKVYTSDKKTFDLAETFNSNATYTKVVYERDEEKNPISYRYIPTAAGGYDNNNNFTLKQDTYLFDENSAWDWEKVEPTSIKIPSSNEKFLSVVENVQVAHLYKDEEATLTFTLTFSDNKTYTFTRQLTFKENLKYSRNQSLEVEDEGTAANAFTLTGSVNGGEELNIVRGEYLNIKALNSIGSFGLASGNNGWSISNEGTLTFEAGNVPAITTHTDTLQIKYSFNGYSYTFYLNVNITINPSYSAEANYPDLDGVEENGDLGYETLVYTSAEEGKSIEGNIKDFFISKKASLAKGNRVVFSAETEKATIDYGEGYSNVTVSIKSITNAKVLVGSEEQDIGTELKDAVTLKPIMGGETPKIVFTITYNKMPQDYVIYLLQGSEIGMTLNSTIHTAEEGGSLVETLYMNTQKDNKIFGANRLAKIEVSDASSLTAGSIYTVKAKREGGTEVTATFQLKAEHLENGRVLYIDLGESCSSITGLYNGSSSASGFKVEGLTQRAIFTYLTIDGRAEITNNKIKGKVGNSIFSEYELRSTTVNRIKQPLTLTATLGETTETTVPTVIYYYKVDLDVAVGHQAQSGGLIEIEAHDRSRYNLIDQALITKASTGEKLKAEDFANAGITTELSVLVGDELDNWENVSKFGESKIFNDNKDQFLLTEEKLKAGVRFLSWTEMKQGTGANENKTWNYTLFGEGAANNGSIVILKYTYTANGISSVFYIPVKIKPDYVITANGEYLVEEPSYGEATNLGNPSVAEVNETGYEIRLANAPSDNSPNAILKITNSNWNNNDVAYTWQYKLTENDGEGIYNNNLNKVNPAGTETNPKDTYGFALSTEIINNVSTKILTRNEDSSGNVHLTRTGLVQFGTKTFKVKISNQYGYVIDFYFILKAQNSENPDVAATSTSSFTEGDSFDIGVVYKNLSLQATDTITVKGETRSDDHKKQKDNLTLNIRPVEEEETPSKSLLQYKKGDEIYVADVGISEDKDVSQIYKLYENKISGTGTYKIYATDVKDIKTYKVATIPPAGAIIFDEFSSENYAVIEIDSVQYLVPLVGIGGVKVGITNDNKVAIFGEATLTAIGTKYQILPKDTTPKDNNADNTNGKIVNLVGINAWGYDKNTNFFPALTENRLANEADKKYFNEDSNTLQYLTVRSVNFLHNGKNVGSITAEDGLNRGLATSGDLVWHDEITVREGTDSKKTRERDYFIEPGEHKNSSGNVTRNLLTIPVLNGDAYKDVPNGGAVSITMRIELQYKKGSGDNEVIESCFVDYIISVSRRLSLEMDSNMVVVDGEEFNLLNTDTNPNGKIKATFGSDQLGENQVTFYDDTLVVVLPARSSVKVEVNVKNTDRKIDETKSTTLPNYSESDASVYQSLSTLMGFVIQPSDEITITFSEYNKSGKVVGSYTGFYATLGNYYWKVDESKEDKITYQVGNYKHQKEGADIKQNCSSLPSITQDKINIAQSGVWPLGDNKFTTVTKNYVVGFTEVTGASDTKYYVYERNYRVVPAFYDLDMALGSDTSLDVAASALIGSSTQDVQYTVEFSEWSKNFTWYTAKTGTTGGPVVRGAGQKVGTGENPLDINYVINKLRFTIGSPDDPDSLGTATIDEHGNITTRAGYVAGGDEYIMVNIFVKSSGADGLFSMVSNYDYHIGSIRLFVDSVGSTNVVALKETESLTQETNLIFTNETPFIPERYFQKIGEGSYILTSDIITTAEDGTVTKSYSAKKGTKVYTIQYAASNETKSGGITIEKFDATKIFQKLSGEDKYIPTCNIEIIEKKAENGETETTYSAKEGSKVYVPVSSSAI